MSIQQKTTKASIFIDFVPAELRENTIWVVEYYCKNPFTDKLERKRNRVRPLKSITARRRLAKIMINTINKKLEKGWSPWITDKNAKSFSKLTEVMSEYLSKMEKEMKKGEKSKDTYRTYKSYIRNLKQYLSDKEDLNLFVINFDNEIVIDFLDHIYYDKNNTARTRNNYLGFLKSLTAYMIGRKYIKTDPCQYLKNIPVEAKKRVYIQENYRNTIFDYFSNNNKNFFTLCMMCYYCLIRRTELTKIRVGDVILKNSIVYIDSSVAKNKKSMPVTIPNVLIPHLANHIRTAHNNQYLFSKNDFAPGDEPLQPKKISDVWSKMRKTTNLPNNIQWYSLKDTGITDLLLKGVELLRVRDQARHHSISQTEDYIPRQLLKADDKIKASGIRFNN